MKRFLSAVALLAVLSGAAAAQECIVSFSLTGSGNSSTTYNNRTNGCIWWTIAYNNTGFSALSLTVQSAPNSSGSPGSWVTFAGTVISGINPNTSTTQASTDLKGYYPFVRATLSSATGTGTVSGTLYGWRQEPSGSSSVVTPLPVEGCGAAGAPAACPPVLVAGIDAAGNVETLKTTTGGSMTTAAFDGTTFQPDITCPTPTPVTLTASGNTQIIALVAAKSIRICHISISGDASVNVKLTRGTGANCGTGTADLTGFYMAANALAMDWNANRSPLIVTAANAVCVNMSAAANWGGVVFYTVY